jgi:hypothetical protein
VILSLEDPKLLSIPFGRIVTFLEVVMSAIDSEMWPELIIIFRLLLEIPVEAITSSNLNNLIEYLLQTVDDMTVIDVVCREQEQVRANSGPRWHQKIGMEDEESLEPRTVFSS